MRALSAPPFGNYHVWWSLADSKYAGTALLVKKCFKPKSVVFNLDKLASKHEPDGRVVLVEFETLRLLNTYVPNNGWKEEANSFQRRRKWDKRILEFVTQNSDKPLIWGKLVDAYRFLHKDKDMERGFSWSGNPVGRYRGKRMRIDYFLVSETLKERIVACEIHGHGIELEGFYGSDHCPVTLELSSSSDPQNEDATKQLP
ncbi:hypothetical protein V8G54_007154 [Vigna mungo]|uniref:DNA-(apurinic or apyrimidinic site) endonuclease n=1 Tax=Vigna mungo TaxID=3915 RepID=A0AAQ3S734_VIGMU